jgi:hypothetical protein
LAYRELELMPEEQPREFFAFLIPLIRDGEEIRILREQHAAQFPSSIQQHGIVERLSSVLKGGQNIDSAAAETFGDGEGDMVVHVEAKGQERSKALSLARI